jgi:hypothetical protein
MPLGDRLRIEDVYGGTLHIATLDLRQAASDHRVMAQRNAVLAAACLALIALLACSQQRQDEEEMVAATKATSDIAQRRTQAEQAASEAEEGVHDIDPAAAQQQVDGRALSWRQLAPLLPDAVLDFEAKGELDGKTTKAKGFEVSEVTRRYGADDTDLRIRITDTSAKPSLRAPFAKVATVAEGGQQIDGYPAIVEWNAKAKSSTASLLVAERFVVNVRVSKADGDGDAEAVAAALKLDELAKLAAAAPTPAQPAK